MKKTKIIATMGPATESKEVFSKIIEAGVNIVRLNFSHEVHEVQQKRIDLIKEVRKELGIPVAILLDTKGPEIRTGMLENDRIELIEGQKFTLTNDDEVGNETKVSISYKELYKDIKIGDSVLIDDGLIELIVDNINGESIECIVKNSGTVKNRKGINVPGVSVKIPAINDKDKADIEFGIKNHIDFIAASFIRKAEDVLYIREILKENNAEHIQIISKIENQEGVDNLDSILEVSDGIMVARGDLGVEIPAQKIPSTQKMIITKCNKAGKPVITSTHMLDSMTNNPRPTRAEITDVANAIYDGTDAVMLSGETAIGKYPVETVTTMANIAIETEGDLDYEMILKKDKTFKEVSVTDAVSYSTCKTSHDLNATAIITATYSGYTARMVSKFRPKTQIIATTLNEVIQRRLLILWGVTPLLIDEVKTIDELLAVSKEQAKEANYIAKGDLVVLTAGVPIGITGATNLMQIHDVE